VRPVWPQKNVRSVAVLASGNEITKNSRGDMAKRKVAEQQLAKKNVAKAKKKVAK
jgi:hypothetical protein